MSRLDVSNYMKKYDLLLQSKNSPREVMVRFTVPYIYVYIYMCIYNAYMYIMCT